MSLRKFITRTSASTKKILGADYLEEVIDVPEAPVPEKDISAYDEDRLKRGLIFADRSIRQRERKVSPGARHCFEVYKNSILDVLEQTFEDQEEKNELLHNVRLYERDIQSSRFLRVLELESGDLITRLAELRRYEFAARYGDYMSIVCANIKHTAQVEKVAHFQELQGWDRYWIDINEAIRKEHPKWRRWEARNRKDPIPDSDVETTLALLNASNHMPMDFDHALEVIKMYADRNERAHLSIGRMVEQGQWHALSAILARDLRELPFFTPHDLRHNIPVMQTIIQSIVDDIFIRRDMNPDNYIAWIPKEESFKRAEAESANQAKRQANVLAERKRVSDLAEKRLKKMVDENVMATLAAEINGSSVEAPSGALPNDATRKRALARIKSERTERRKRQLKGWKQIVSIGDSLSRGMKKYVEKFGPVDPEFWMDLYGTDSGDEGADEPEDVKGKGKGKAKE